MLRSSVLTTREEQQQHHQPRLTVEEIEERIYQLRRNHELGGDFSKLPKGAAGRAARIKLAKQLDISLDEVRRLVRLNRELSEADLDDMAELYRREGYAPAITHYRSWMAFSPEARREVLERCVKGRFSVLEFRDLKQQELPAKCTTSGRKPAVADLGDGDVMTRLVRKQRSLVKWLDGAIRNAASLSPQCREHLRSIRKKLD